MNEQDRKFLQVDVLGEEWHRATSNTYLDGLHLDCRCGKNTFDNCHNRTFTTAQDAYDLEQAIKHQGLMHKLDWFIFNTTCGDAVSYLSKDASKRCQFLCDFFKEVER